MEILNPRRILAVSLTESSEHLSKVVKDLTGSHPSPADPAALAGTTHELRLDTPYYVAQVPVWLDLVASPAEWAATFLSAEAAEVLAALGAVVVVFEVPLLSTTTTAVAAASLPSAVAEGRKKAGGEGEDHQTARDLLAQVGRVLRQGLGDGWDGVALAVGVARTGGLAEDVLEGWEDVCVAAGMEFVLVAPGVEGRNEFGEKVGIPRAREALEANDWASAPALDDEFGEFGEPFDADLEDEGEGEADLDPESLDFGFDREDFAGLRKAIWSAGRHDDEGFMDEPEGQKAGPSTGSADAGEGEGEGELDDKDIAKLEGMMRKLQAVRDMSAGMPEEQRKRMAARAVGEVMKEL